MCLCVLCLSIPLCCRLKLLLGRGISLKQQGMSSNGFDVLMWCCDHRFTTNAAGKVMKRRGCL